jgi:sugar transferase (PEP-CTERM/EpsH1 system associated)
MRILFLSPRQCIPARNGAKIREYHFLRALGAAGEVTLLHFLDPGASPVTTQDLPFCREVIGIPKPPAYAASNAVRAVFGQWPLPILNFVSPEMTAAVDRALSGSPFDIIHLDSIHMIWYARAAVERQRSIRAIYNWHNIESEAIRRYASATSSLPHKWYAHLTATKMQRLEGSILQNAFGHIVCSQRELEQLRPTAPQARIAVAENGVDVAYFSDSAAGELPGKRIVFVGAMDYRPNSEAAIHFANRIWPQIRLRLSDAELVIVGASPGPAVLALGKLPGVRIAGSVPDVRPWYRGALAAVVPLLSGGGTRLKILEAMAAGVPVISTPLGAEGLDVTPGRDLLVARHDDGNAWVEAVVRVSEEPAVRSQMIAAGLQLVTSRYDWQIIGSKVRNVYEDWVRGGEDSATDR